MLADDVGTRQQRNDVTCLALHASIVRLAGGHA